jgi:hypothetical protein
MDLFQNEVTSLSTKVDALHEVLEQLRSQTTEILSEVKGTTGDRATLPPAAPNRYSFPNRNHLNGGMEHKDVLSDDTYPDSETQNGNRPLAPEIQIQRLTAQLTAAYNRIAALEEQLLAQRIH